MDGKIERVYGILSMQIAAVSCMNWNSLKFISKTNDMYKSYMLIV